MFPSTKELPPPSDVTLLTRREWALLAPIAAVVLWMGVYPESFMAPMRKDVETLMARIERAVPAGDAQLEKGAGMPKGAHGADGEHAAAPAPGATPAADMHIAPPAGEAEVH